MHLDIRRFDGIPFIASPYRAGRFLRHDVFWRQFSIVCQGKVEYPEDDPVYGTWWTPHTLPLGQHGLIEATMALASRRVARHEFDLGSLELDALDFQGERVLILDARERRVLAGQVEDRRIRWCDPVGSDKEAADVARQIGELRDEAADEARWDNVHTAEALWLKARVLDGRQVDAFWREHARQAVQTASAACGH